MTYKEFRSDVLKEASNRPNYIRFGQSVFNYIDSKYGVARTVQFVDGVDCFYDDNKVEEFIKLSYNHAKETCSWTDKSQ